MILCEIGSCLQIVDMRCLDVKKEFTQNYSSITTSLNKICLVAPNIQIINECTYLNKCYKCFEFEEYEFDEFGDKYQFFPDFHFNDDENLKKFSGIIPRQAEIIVLR